MLRFGAEGIPALETVRNTPYPETLVRDEDPLVGEMIDEGPPTAARVRMSFTEAKTKKVSHPFHPPIPIPLMTHRIMHCA